MTDDPRQPNALDMRVSERDSAELALGAAHSGVADATSLLDAALEKVRRIEATLHARRVEQGEPADLPHLESDALGARDTVAACHVALHEAQRIVAEYEHELHQLDSLVETMRSEVESDD